LPFTRTFVPWVTVPDFRRSIDANFEKLRAPWLLDLLNDLPEGTTIATACHSQFFCDWDGQSANKQNITTPPHLKSGLAPPYL
jgi:hypothetical protein